MSAMASLITGLSLVYSTVSSGANQGIDYIKAPRHWPLWGEFSCSPGNSPQKGTVTQKMFSFADVIMGNLKKENIDHNIQVISIETVKWYFVNDNVVGDRLNRLKLKFQIGPNPLRIELLEGHITFSTPLCLCGWNPCAWNRETSLFCLSVRWLLIT